MTKCIKRIRDLFEYALYKFTLYLLTYFLTDLLHIITSTADGHFRFVDVDDHE